MAQAGQPPRRIVVIARILSWVPAHAPFLWPLLRRPVQRFWDRAAPQWDAGRGAAERTAPLAAACDRLDSLPRRILELGTGTGSGAYVLAERFPEADILAVDLSDEMIRLARAKTPPPRLRF